MEALTRWRLLAEAAPSGVGERPCGSDEGSYLRLKDLLGPVTSVKKKKKGSHQAGYDHRDASASERRGNNLKGSEDFCQKAKARIWP